KLSEDPRFYPVFRIGSSVEVLREELLAAGMRDEILVQQLELSGGDLAVAVPPHRILGQRIDDGVLVLRRPAGVDAGFRADRAALHEGSLAGGERVFVEGGDVQVPAHRGEVVEAEFVSAIGAVARTGFLHEHLPLPSGRRRNSLPAPVSYGTAAPDYSGYPQSARPIVGIMAPARTTAN